MTDLSLPLDKVSGTILSKSTNSGQMRSIVSCEYLSEIPDLRGGVFLANHQMEFPIRPDDKLWNSKVYVTEQYAAFGTPESNSSLYSYLYAAGGCTDALAKIMRIQEWLLKVSTCRTFIIHLGPCSYAFCKDEFSTDRSQYSWAVPVSTINIYIQYLYPI